MIEELFSENEMRYFMNYCINLAEKAPEGVRKPYVGAVVVSPSKEIVGEGYRSFLDTTSLLLHAERMALHDAGEHARRSYLFTTSEPCSLTNRKNLLKPCAHLIPDYGIEGVVFGVQDSHGGKKKTGSHFLEGQGIQVLQYSKLNGKIWSKLMNRNKGNM